MVSEYHSHRDFPKVSPKNLFQGNLVVSALSDRVVLARYRYGAAEVAKAAAAYDSRRAQASWLSWIHDGPNKSCSRLHRMTRVATGWIPSVVVEDSAHGDGELDVDWQPEEAILQAPLGAQQECDAQAEQWSREWAVGQVPLLLPWPADMRPGALPPLTATCMRDSAMTFPAGAGLGWDKLHPRAVARLGDGALCALASLLVAIVCIGAWPQLIGVVLVVFIPKPDGGPRPVGLLPTLVRWWMRARLGVVRQWQDAHDRAFFYAGPHKGAKVAAGSKRRGLSWRKPAPGWSASLFFWTWSRPLNAYLTGG